MTITYQWCIEQSGKDDLFATYLRQFYKYYKLLKRGKAALCLTRVDSEEGEIKRMFWAYSARGVLKKFIDELGTVYDYEIPERFVSELSDYASKRSSNHSAKKKENIPVYTYSVSLADRIHKDKKTPFVAVKPNTIPVRVDRKTIIYMRDTATPEEVDRIIELYNSKKVKV